MAMLTVVCFKWGALWPRIQYEADHVNVLRNMVQRHLHIPHRFVCITDQAKYLPSDIETIPLWDDFKELTNPRGERFPSCYRRLRMFDEATCKQLDIERMLLLDLDLVITNDFTPLVDIDADFKILKSALDGQLYNGSMILMNAGARQQVWDEFDPDTSIAKAKDEGYIGSDQAWIASCLGPNEQTWSKEDGVYSFVSEIKPYDATKLPDDAKIVNFAGNHKPWHHVSRNAWVRANYK